MTNQTNQKSNVIDLFENHFPVGSKAWHKKYRVCYVVKTLGLQRQIKSIGLTKHEIEWEYHIVPVNELTRITNPLEI